MTRLFSGRIIEPDVALVVATHRWKDVSHLSIAIVIAITSIIVIIIAITIRHLIFIIATTTNVTTTTAIIIIIIIIIIVIIIAATTNTGTRGSLTVVRRTPTTSGNLQSSYTVAKPRLTSSIKQAKEKLQTAALLGSV